MRILVTGGAGFIGSHVVEHFQSLADVRVLDNLRTGHRENLANLDVEFIEASILDEDAVRQAVDGVDYVFHMAAFISVPESMTDPVECVRINCEGTLNMLTAAAAAGVKKLCFSSSSAVYGETESGAETEDLKPAPRSPYAVTKLDGEFYCDMFTTEQQLPTACLRYFNVFGPRQDPHSAYAAAIPHFIDRAIHGDNLVIYDDGEQSRDFVYVKDVVAANVHLAFREQSGIFNAAYGRSTTINDLARKIIELTGSSSGLVYQPPRPGDIRHSLADTRRLAATGFQPTCDFDRGLAATIDHFRNRDLN